MPLERSLVLESGYFRTPLVHMSSHDYRSVALVGASHLGLLSYYTLIQQLLDAAEARGQIITHEGANWSNQLVTGFPPFSAEETRDIWPSIVKANQALNAFGVGEQPLAITPRQSWIFTDTYHPQAAKQIVSAMSLTPQLAKERLLEVAAQPREFLERAKKAFERHCRQEVPSTPLFYERDKGAVEAILGYASDRDVTSCWGARHLIGMTSLLEQASFQIESVEWLPCFPEHIPNE